MEKCPKAKSSAILGEIDAGISTAHDLQRNSNALAVAGNHQFPRSRRVRIVEIASRRSEAEIAHRSRGSKTARPFRTRKPHLRGLVRGFATISRCQLRP